MKEQKFQDIDVEVWDQVMSVNLRGTFLMCKHVVPHMIAQNYGKIINIGSGTPTRGVPWLLHYTTTKGGVIGMTSGDVARIWRAMHPRQHAVAGLHHE